MGARDKMKGLNSVRDGSEKVDRKRLGRKQRSMKYIIMFSAVYKSVQQIFNFAGSSGVAADAADLGEPD